MKRGLVWFRNDLRTRDNESLRRAVNECDEVFPVYVLDPRIFRDIDPGFRKTGPFRTRFLLDSLQTLDRNLKKAGSGLIFRQGYPEEIIPELVSEYDIRTVYASKETTWEELNAERLLEKALAREKVLYESSWQHTLFHEEDVPWPIRQVPEAFTSFRKEAEKMVEVRDEFEAPSSIRTPVNTNYGELPGFDILPVEPEKADERSVIEFRGGEDAAWDRLNYYFWEADLLKQYKNTRNGLLGGDYSSKLSPWLAMGCISAKSVYYEIRRYEKERTRNSSTYWLFFELLWRDFFRFMSKKHGAAIFRYEGFNGTPPDYNEDMEKFDRWRFGKTGESFVDANMKELLLTGYMSNRGRQNTASYLMYDLGVKWTWGAAWFENRLIDYDPCSNWLNWAYIAGVGNDPRQGRQFSIESQSARYDPKNLYVSHWLERDAQDA